MGKKKKTAIGSKQQPRSMQYCHLGSVRLQYYNSPPRNVFSSDTKPNHPNAHTMANGAGGVLVSRSNASQSCMGDAECGIGGSGKEGEGGRKVM